LNNSNLPRLALNDLVLGYQQPLVPAIAWQLQAGEKWVITGPNGCGKSLLLKTLAGHVPPVAGGYRWLPGTRWVYLAQEHPRPGLWPMNGQDWLQAMGVTPNQVPLVKHLLNKRLDELSGGQWQLLRLASVLGADADVVLLDEPSNHLDAKVRQQSLALLAQLKPEQTLLMASHDQDFIQASGAREQPMAQLAAEGRRHVQ